MRNRYFPKRPMLIKAKYASTCACGTAIKPGDEILWFPLGKKAECRTCATPTLEALADEDQHERMHREVYQ